MSGRRLAFVVQRYGEGVTGGSESLARALAERLVPEDEVTVLTTRARDYVTWRDELPAGRSSLGGVAVERFGVDEERDLASFNAFSDGVYARPGDPAREQEWLRRQGPYAPRLVAALRERHDEFTAVVFFTYLYYPTVAGLESAAGRSLLVPTAHDEPPLRLSLFREMFARPRAFGFLTPPEAALVESRFELGARPRAVAGIGVDTPAPADVEAFRIEHDLSGPFVLYAGRIDAGKGCTEMLDHYQRYRRDVRGAAELVLIGKLAMPEPHAPGVRYLGFLPEAQKAAALEGARAVLCPSPFESLSIVLLEGMAHGTPALVNARSPVLLDHCRRSEGGLWYESGDEFREALDLLVRRGQVRDAMAAAGRRYVERDYRWEVVLGRYRDLIDAAAEAG